MADLTDKQQRFCDEYLKDYNGTRAAIRAGYSEISAHSIASENLMKPEIQSYLEKKKDKIAKKLEISQERILRELAAIAFSDIREFYDEQSRLKPIQDLDESAAAAIASLDNEEVFEKTPDGMAQTGEIKKMKRWDKLKAIETINKMLGYNSPDKIEQTVNQRTVIIDTTGEADNSVYKEASGSKEDS